MKTQILMIIIHRFNASINKYEYSIKRKKFNNKDIPLKKGNSSVFLILY